ncbi:MAG: catalase, partial [Pikeienuella sp.]
EQTPWFQKIINKFMMRKESPPPPEGVVESGSAGLAEFAGTHAFARAFVMQAGLEKVPVSWARTEYHTVHTFMAVRPDGRRQPVRFTWQPVDGVFPIPEDELAKKKPDFLTGELENRLKIEPAQFTLRMALGDPGDDLEDPTVIWPVTRRSINMGTLVVEGLTKDGDVDVETLSFNPMRLQPGVEPSNDAILRARGDIYQLGCAERNGTGCPLHANGGA